VSDAPIGIFDSGIGGLSVAREIRSTLPAEHLLYIADSRYLPYGDRPEAWVRERSVALGRWMQTRGAKLLVVACNTASGAALEALREVLTIPVIGMEPALKPAVAASRSRRVGVLATTRTIGSARFQRLVDGYADGVVVVRRPCPGLAELVEEGPEAPGDVEAAIAGYVAPLVEERVDTVVLGCTHYVFVRDEIQRALGPGVRLIDSGAAIARRTAQLLGEGGARAPEGAGSFRFLTSAEPAAVRGAVERLWAEPVAIECLEP
jgi:glutamate racemase